MMGTLHQKPLLKYIACVLWINVIEHIIFSDDIGTSQEGVQVEKVYRKYM